MPEVFLTVKEVAHKLSIKPKTVRKWLREGKLKGVKLGRLWRIREADIDKLAETGLIER
jgi:excisionase family DNA binding protein